MHDLSWTKISNGKDFQNLVNDLFALEINHPAFLSSNPDIGKDDGWDGRFKGKYMNLDGVWNFQAKWTKHNLNEAYKQLRQELIKELEKAKKNSVKYLLFATNADLRVGTKDHIGKLEMLNIDKKYVEKLFIWSRANLEGKIIQYPLLRNIYFGDPQEPMFVPPHIYANSESTLSEFFIGREELINNFKNIIDNDTNLVIVHTGGGYGKTHFIVELAKQSNQLFPDFSTWFCRPNIRDINDAINELNHEKDNLIFLDDAERYLEDAKKIIAHIKTYAPGKLKVILSSRTSGKEILKNLADTQRIDNYKVFELPLLPNEKLIQILKNSAGTKKIEHPERIVNELNKNLFLIVTTGKLIKGGEVNPKKIKKNIKDNLEHDAITALKDLLNPLQIKKLLMELSIIVPLYNDSQSKVFEKLSTILKIDIDVISEAISILVNSKILHIIGASIRFNPDMKGDIYLSVLLDSNDGKKITNAIFENWLQIHPKRIIANIGAASRHLDTKASSIAVKELIEKWISEISDTPDFLKTQRLELITPIAFLAPGESINLIHAYIDTMDTDSKSIYKLNKDSFGPVIYQILHVPGYEEIILDLVLKISNKDIPGTYDNYKPSKFIKQITSPIEVNINLAINSLSKLSTWIEKENCSEIEAELVSMGVQESLNGSHEYSESYGNQITFGRKTLLYKKPVKEKVDKYRDIGLEALRKLILHPKDKVKKMGIKIINEIGSEPSSKKNNLWKRIISDKTKAIDWLDELVKNKPSFEVLSAIEDVLIRYWTNNHIHSALSNKAASILRNYPRTPEYILFQYFVAHDVIISDFTKLEKSAPTDKRWSWLVHNHFRLRDFKKEDFDNLIEIISKKYNTTVKVIDYLKDLDKETEGISQWQYIPLIESWSIFNKQSFVEIANDQSLFEKIPGRFHLGIYRVCSDIDKKYISNYANQILSDVQNIQPQSVGNLLDLISRHNLSVKIFIPWISKIIENADDNIKNIILHRSYFIFKDKEERSSIIFIFEKVLEGNSIDPIIGMFEFLLSNTIEWNLSAESINRIRDKLFEKIKDVQSIDYHADELLKFVINGSLDRFIEIVEFRLTKYHSEENSVIGNRFDPVPYDGFHSSEGLIKGYSDFEKFMDKVNYWRTNELLYSIDVDNLLKYINKHDKEHHDYLLCYIEEKIKKENSESVKIACNGLYGVQFDNDTADIFLKLLLTAKRVGVLDQAKEVFSNQIFTGSYTSIVGEAPPFLINKKDSLIKIHKKCPPGIIKNYLEIKIKIISSTIQKHIEDGKEITNPKS